MRRELPPLSTNGPGRYDSALLGAGRQHPWCFTGMSQALGLMATATQTSSWGTWLQSQHLGGGGWSFRECVVVSLSGIATELEASLDYVRSSLKIAEQSTQPS